MASAVTTQHVFAEEKHDLVLHNSGQTNAQVLTPDTTTTRKWYDMSGYEFISFDVLTVISGSTSGPTLCDIVAADDTSGTNTVVVVSHTVVSAANAANGSKAIGDSIFVEASAAQIREVVAAAGNTGGRYASLRITSTNTTDVQAVTIVRSRPKSPQSNLTADVVA